MALPSKRAKMRSFVDWIEGAMRGVDRGRAALRGALGAASIRHIGALLNFYPPFVGAGIRVVDASPDGLRFEVELRLSAWNQNVAGTHFGGSLYAMCDPFFALILIRRLGPDYVVWDKAASIRFRRPGKGTVRAVFTIPVERVAEVVAEVEARGKAEPHFEVEVIDEQGCVVALVQKVVHVRRNGK